MHKELQELSSNMESFVKNRKNFGNTLLAQIFYFFQSIFKSFYGYAGYAVKFYNQIKDKINIEKKFTNNQNLYKQVKIFTYLFFKTNIIKALRFFTLNSAHIEVLRNKKLEKIYFILIPYCNFIPKVNKNNI